MASGGCEPISAVSHHYTIVARFLFLERANSFRQSAPIKPNSIYFDPIQLYCRCDFPCPASINSSEPNLWRFSARSDTEINQLGSTLIVIEFNPIYIYFFNTSLQLRSNKKNELCWRDSIMVKWPRPMKSRRYKHGNIAICNPPLRWFYDIKLIGFGLTNSRWFEGRSQSNQ